MKWSWRIARIAGIDVYVHATFLLILAWVAFVNYSRTGQVFDAVWGLVILLAVFAVVVAHEFGHALTARRFGIQTRDITLLPIGGLARLERMPDKPVQELLVALAGPAVNIVLAVVLGFVLVLTGFPDYLREIIQQSQVMGDSEAVERLVPQPGMMNFLFTLFYINIFLALFNLLPAFPMDGGRVLRALLAMKLDYVQATQVASSIGQAMALLFGLLGLVAGNVWLIIIAVFVWMGAASEASLVQIRSALGGIPVSRAMIREFHSLAPHDSLQKAVEYILAGFQQDFPVIEDGRLVGVLTRGNLLSALARDGSHGLVGDAMDRNFETADPFEMLDGAFARLQACDCRAVPVTRNGSLVGILTMDNVGEFMIVQSALRTIPTPRVPQ